MRLIALFILLSIANKIHSQISIRPTSVSVSYLGETITHPGAKISVDYEFKRWNKVKKTKRGLAKTKFKAQSINWGLGVFYHKDYQSSLFILPEYDYFIANKKGRFWSFGGGFGYMRTRIPNTFVVDENGIVEQEEMAGHNYGLIGVHMSFGKDYYLTKEKPFRYFIKPQFLLALPNYPNAVGYLLLEAGVSFKLSRR